MDFRRPFEGEYAPYYEKYINLVPDNALGLMVDQLMAFPLYLRSIPVQMADYKYAPDKWTVKQVAGHIIDTERVMAYRALRIARNDSTVLPGFDENAFVANAPIERRTLDDLAAEFEIVRKGSLFIFQYLEAEEFARKGTASDNPVSVNALMYIIAGHLQHHLAIYEERYFGKSAVTDQ